MRHRLAVLRWLAVLCLGTAALIGGSLAWPSPRDAIAVSLSGDQMRSGWISLVSAGNLPEATAVPGLELSLHLPRSALLGREERIELVAGVLPDSAGPGIFSIIAGIPSADARITPPGESGQALRDGAAFEWTVIATRAPTASATLVVRLRRHSPEGMTEAERLVLARDLALPVRTIAGLSAPVARIAAAVMGLAGAFLGIASGIARRG